MLQGVNLELETGKITTIIGGSGSGKTVLLKHLNALLLPDRGSVLVDGTDITKLGESALNDVRQKFGVLFQGAALLDSMTIFDNVAFPLREKTKLGEGEIRQRVEERLDQVGLSGMGYKYPAEVSGGMKKRAGLARALVMRAGDHSVRRAHHRPRPAAGQEYSPFDPQDARDLWLYRSHRQPRHSRGV